MRKKWSIIGMIGLLLVLLANPTPAAEAVSAPGGRVTTAEELAEALGGSAAAQVKDGAVLLLSDVRLREPIELRPDAFEIFQLIGAGCVIAADFTDGPFFSVGDGTSAARLILGRTDAKSSDDSLILNGEGTSRTAPMIEVGGGSELYVCIGTALTDQASHAAGGAIGSEGRVFLYGGRIENCRSTESGGAIASAGELTLTLGSIRNCSAARGGAVFSSGKVALGGTEIADCRADEGGILYNAGEAELISSTLSVGSAARGGGVYNAGTLTLSGGQILECTAEEGEGGGLYNVGTASLSGTYFKDNAAENGGSVYNAGTAELTGGQIVDAAAADRGGHFYNATDGVLTVSAGSVSRGKARYGGGIFNAGRLTVLGGGFNLNSAEIGSAILNEGAMILREYPYIDAKNDVFIVTEEGNPHALILESEMKADPNARLTPGVRDGDGYAVRFTEGGVLLTGEYVSTGVSHFRLSEDGANRWTLDESGSLSKQKPAYAEPWFYLALAGAFAVTVAVLVLAIRSVDRKKASAQAE